MRRYSCVSKLASRAVAASVIASAGLVVSPTTSHAQSCPVEGGYTGGGITQILRWKQYGSQALADLPKGPLPSGYGLNVYVDATAWVSGSCDDYDWNGVSCYLARTYLNTISVLNGKWSRPNEPPDRWNSFEYAINPNGTTASVTSMDSRDDTTTAGGPVTILPSGAADSAAGVQPGTYRHRTTSNVAETPCDGSNDYFIGSSPKGTGVSDTDNQKDICPAKDEEDGGIPELDSGVAEIEVSAGGGADSIGNPCSARSGNKSEREVDSPGPVLPFVRTYSSLAMYDLGLGYGWSSPYHGRILTPLGDLLNVVRTNGHAEVFTKQGDGSWLGDADTRYAITEDANGFVLTHRDGRKETYGLDGVLVSESDPSGNTTTYLYNASGQLESVTGPYGHQLGFAYDSDGHLQTVTTPGNLAITYAYTDDHLTSVTYPDTRTRLYHYENAAQPHKLTGLTDEDGVRFATFGYDSQGRATSTEHATTTNGTPQERFTLAFYNGWTRVTNPRGHQEDYVFSENLKYKRLTRRLHMPDSLAVDQTFDASNRLLTRTDELGRMTAFGWSATNQLTSRTEAQGTPEARTTTFAYLSPSLDLPTLITRPSVASGQSATKQVTWDPVHLRPTQVSESGYRAPSVPHPTRATTFAYNSRGQLTQSDGPRTDVADLTTFTYWECATGAECGQLKTTANALGHTTYFDVYDGEGRILEMRGSPRHGDRAGLRRSRPRAKRDPHADRRRGPHVELHVRADRAARDQHEPGRRHAHLRLGRGPRPAEHRGCGRKSGRVPLRPGRKPDRREAEGFQWDAPAADPARVRHAQSARADDAGHLGHGPRLRRGG